MENILFEANKKLGIKEDLNIPKNRNLIFVYSSAKCGSTSLVSSLRLSCFEQYTVIHLHNDTMLKIMYKIHDVTIQEIIEFNRSLNKTIYVFDIFREPIEHKMSLYFEILDTFHFNVNGNNSDDLKTLTLEKIVKRFNLLFPHIVYLDYFESVYKFQAEIEEKPVFDFEKGYMHFEDSNGVNYIKLRLRDANTKWSSILSQLLKNNIWVVKDNITSASKRPMHKFYEQFKKTYKLPINYFKELADMPLTYLDAAEKQQYLDKWLEFSDPTTTEPFTDEQYRLYVEISKENKHISQCHLNHYLDNGCDCKSCCEKRNQMRQSLGVEARKQQGKKMHAMHAPQPPYSTQSTHATHATQPPHSPQSQQAPYSILSTHSLQTTQPTNALQTLQSTQPINAVQSPHSTQPPPHSVHFALPLQTVHSINSSNPRQNSTFLQQQYSQSPLPPTPTPQLFEDIDTNKPPPQQSQQQQPRPKKQFSLNFL